MTSGGPDQTAAGAAEIRLSVSGLRGCRRRFPPCPVPWYPAVCKNARREPLN